MHDEMQPQNQASPEHDNEGAMARADLFKLANYSVKLFKKLEDGQQLEAWVQAKITKAADYIASVYHYLEYEMEFSQYGEKLENSDVYSESQKQELKNKLMEAKEKLKTLKIAQAEKISVKEALVIGGGKEQSCPECGGSGVVISAGKVVPAHVQDKVEKYKRLTKATHAAHKRLDRNNNGIPDNLEDDEVDEDQSGLKKSGDSYKTAKGGTVTKTATGIKHERDPESYDDGGDETDTMAKSGKGTKSHAKSQSAAEKKERAPAQKKSKTGTWGMEGGEKFDNRKKEEAVDEMYGQGVYEGKKAKKDYDGDGKVESEKDEVWGSRMKAAKKAGKMEEAAKPDYIDLDKDGNKKEPMKKAAKDAKKVKESTGDYSAKKAAAGKDIGKPGKNFAKIAKKAGGGEKGEKIAGAVLKNLRKESTEPQAEVIAESADLARIKQFLTRLNG